MCLKGFANDGPHLSCSQFYITCRPLPHMNKQNVAFGRVVEDTALSVARPASRVPLATRHAGKGPVRSRRSRVYDEPGVPPVHVAVVYHKEADSLPQCRFGTTSGRLSTLPFGLRGREPVGAFAIGARETARSTMPPP